MSHTRLGLAGAVAGCALLDDEAAVSSKTMLMAAATGAPTGVVGGS